jgi:hypothetical protein
MGPALRSISARLGSIVVYVVAKAMNVLYAMAHEPCRSNAAPTYIETRDVHGLRSVPSTAVLALTALAPERGS